MSRTLEALKRAEAQRSAQPPGAQAGLDPQTQAADAARASRAAERGWTTRVWVAVVVLALLAMLCGWWAFGPAFTVRLGQSAVAPLA